MKLVIGVCALLLTAGGALARAGPPQPAKPVPANLYSGRWYEIARTPNQMQNGCQGSTSDFSGWSAGGAFSVVQTCHKGSLSGPTQTYNARGKILSNDNAKMKLGFFGGLISQEYWILDHADDNAWAIMARYDGRYVWLLSRRPVLDGAEKQTALSRLKALGFDLTHLAFPAQPTG
ncbi:MAG: lipocalin family protein [Caulobacteraceae bacterium]|nr:lipocalin family protein [Caulobacteraceae bacterium]